MKQIHTDSPRAIIANQIVHLYSEYYGRGPTKAKTYMVDDLVVVVLEETFTAAERTIIANGDFDVVRLIRRRFQAAMKERFVDVIESVTGRRVRSFLSETDLERDIAVELFLLDPEDKAPYREATEATEAQPA